MIILSDVHCDFNHVINVCQRYVDQTVVQLGDLGIGFLRTEYVKENTPSNFRFFVGNHDNRTFMSFIALCSFEEIFSDFRISINLSKTIFIVSLSKLCFIIFKRL